MAGVRMWTAGDFLASVGGSDVIRILGVDNAGATLASGTDGVGQAFSTVVELPPQTRVHFVDTKPGSQIKGTSNKILGIVRGDRECYLELTIPEAGLDTFQLIKSGDNGYFWTLGYYKPSKTGWLKRTFNIGQFESNIDEVIEPGQPHSYTFKFIPIDLETA
ncbi:MAG: hypothetical protein KDC45_09400, partial [Bacteroidetes bacterium]|nr:hypothetical protein [Bacteroidota bacterium]